MGIEIERKFLLKNDSWRAHVQSKSRIIQAYISVNPAATVRVRVTAAGAFLTLKGKRHNYSAAEFEYKIPAQDAAAMLELMSPYPPIDKWRYRVSYAGNSWEIDEFNGANAGLLIAEIELDTATAEFACPPWLGMEVSDDPRYFNACLVQQPYSTWGK
ncbi:MAG: CYTH domain-containing protein [Desulfuromonadaceae bacterium]|nr:CYTH domain-containing protein [Desulfuromonas sp.]MDY0185345.1 CYTH domain-containing protein [Desulfuromonadaceae bacterium]